MSSHSAILGGSNASRLLNCPASYAEQMKSPISDVESVYAAEGTALHEAVAELYTQRRSVKGKTYGNFVIDDSLDAVLLKAIGTLEGLKESYGGGFRTIAVEKTLALPGVNGAFGSVDLILASKTHVLVVDWKFGSGVPVHALYTNDDHEAYLNPQLAFYTAAARAGHARAFKGKTIVTAIIQPRLDPPMSWAETDDDELDAFLAAFQHAFIEALGKKAHRERGEWCRFATCKSTCPLWTGPVFDLALIDPTKAALAAPSDYGAFLARALDMATLSECWAEEVRRQAHALHGLQLHRPRGAAEASRARIQRRRSHRPPRQNRLVRHVEQRHD